MTQDINIHILLLKSVNLTPQQEGRGGNSHNGNMQWFHLNLNSSSFSISLPPPQAGLNKMTKVPTQTNDRSCHPTVSCHTIYLLHLSYPPLIICWTSLARNLLLQSHKTQKSILLIRAALNISLFPEIGNHTMNQTS